jgi:hypothetical protein
MWLGDTGYENSSVSYIGKHDQKYRVILQALCGLQALQPCPQEVAALFPPVGLAALTQRPTSAQGTARSLSAARRVRREYLNLKLFNYYYYYY